MEFTPERYRELSIRYQEDQRAVWCFIQPTTRPCCTPELLAELEHFHREIAQHVTSMGANGSADTLRFLVLASRTPGVFSLGGDLVLFIKLIRSSDRAGLERYVKSCIDLLNVGYHMPLTTVALVQGDALGGGFEGALMSRVIVAERQARMGIPDVLFNFFPAVAYSLLARRIGPVLAERMIVSGNMYSAEELYRMGVVDVLAENGEGEAAVDAYMNKQSRANNTYQALHQARQLYQPLNENELFRIADIWVGTAMKLSERDLRVMERIAQSQQRLVDFRQPAEVQQFA